MSWGSVREFLAFCVTERKADQAQERDELSGPLGFNPTSTTSVWVDLDKRITFPRVSLWICKMGPT